MLYAARCLLASRGITDPSEDALIGATLEVENYHHLRALGALARRLTGMLS